LAAEIWATYKRLAIELAVADCGALLRDSLALPASPVNCRGVENG